MDSTTHQLLVALEQKVLWLSTWMVHHANHLRENVDGLKVGGHQASSASVSTILTALYFTVLRPEDRVAVKPHASPIFHAIQYLLGRQTVEKLKAFRAFGGAQSYPSRTKDTDDVDFSTGSVGLGAAISVFASLTQNYLQAHGWLSKPPGRMISIVGDAELDEGNIYECLLEGWKQGLRSCWWVIDYNRQSLDAVVREGLSDRIVTLFDSMGWEVCLLKYGRLLEAAFAEPGGAQLRDWIDRCPNEVYSALCFQGGAAWRKRLHEELGDQGAVAELIDLRDDAALARLMTNLGGHDLEALISAFQDAPRDRPVCFVAYTIKGFGLPLQGHKDNHAGILTTDQMARLRVAMNIREGREWNIDEGLDVPPAALRSFLEAVPFNAQGERRHRTETVSVPPIAIPSQRVTSTQQGFGQILHDIARTSTEFADRIVTTSPDVTVSTNLGPWVNKRGLFGTSKSDLFREEQIASTQHWAFSPEGQHIELGIAEMNLFLNLSALGLSHSLFGTRLLPIGTLYDPFIGRGLDALNYACYQDARFLLVATPSGVTLGPEGGAHQSVSTPLIGIGQDGLAAFEPAFVDELAVIMEWTFDYIQRDGTKVIPSDKWLRDELGGSVYLRLSTRSVEQPPRTIGAGLRRQIIDGGYWIREPGPNCELVVAATGSMLTEAIAAVGRLGEFRRDVGLLVVTSADRLNAGWSAACRARACGDEPSAKSHVEQLLSPLPRQCGIVTLVDGHPLTLAWFGAVMGHRVHPLGVEHFGQSGSLVDLYRSFAIDWESVVAGGLALTPGRQ